MPIRGPYKGREKQHEEAIRLRKLGYGYRSIGSMVDVPWRTICEWVKGIESDPGEAHRLASERSRKPFSSLTNKKAMKKALIRDRGYACEGCGLSEWMGEEIVLELHRMSDKDYRDCEKDELSLLCPNCHSMTPNWKNRPG